MVSHNLQQRGAPEAGDVKFAVEQRMGAAVMLLQEMRNWPDGQGVLSGYELYTDIDLDTAVAKPPDFACDACEKSYQKGDHCLALPHVEWDHDSCWTHRNSNKGGLLQLDYMVVSEHVHGEACVVRCGYHLNSDHWPIDGSLRLERRELWSTVNHDEFSQRGWAPKSDEAQQFFMRRVAKDLCWMNEEARGKALLSVEEIIYSHAVGTDSDNSAFRQWSRPQEHRKRLAEFRELHATSASACAETYVGN